MSTNHILTTSLAEIRSFKPCTIGWRDILTARKPQCDADYDIQFPLVDCLESNSIADVCWLIGKRKKEIQICVQFARMCADSVKDLKGFWSKSAAAAAAAAAAFAADAADAAFAADAFADAAFADAAAAAAAADAAFAAAADATDAAFAAADAAAAAAAAAADAAADAADAAYNKQKEKNKQFLIQCINEYQQS